MAAEVPILYRKARAWIASFPCPVGALTRTLPDPSLSVVSVLPGVAPLTVAVFECEDTTIGPHHEVVLGFPVRHRKSTAMPLVPLLAERWLIDLGVWVHVLAVDSTDAGDAARATWGLPATTARIAIDTRIDRTTCAVSDDDGAIFSVEYDRPTSPAEPMHFPLRLWSKKDAELLRTELDVDAMGSLRRVGARARLVIEDHPLVAHLASLGLARASALEVRWLDAYRTSLGLPAARFLSSPT
jgi:hypothetical protein